MGEIKKWGLKWSNMQILFKIYDELSPYCM